MYTKAKTPSVGVPMGLAIPNRCPKGRGAGLILTHISSLHAELYLGKARCPFA